MAAATNTNTARPVPAPFTDKTNTAQWLKENEPSFAPPVCNKLMSGGQLKVMYIGGPNVRKDFHINQGEELFYMVRGDMVLKVMEKGEEKDIPIKEGELFLLSGSIPHSPQRREDTVGLVLERERLAAETDGLRYYHAGKPLWEKWFHCDDLGSQLGPIIKEYFASEQCASLKPVPGTASGEIWENAPVKLDETTVLPEPFSVDTWLKQNEGKLADGPIRMVDGAETAIDVYRGPASAKDVVFPTVEAWVWQYRGRGVMTTQDSELQFEEGDTKVLVPDQTFSWRLEHDAVGFVITMTPKPRASD